jgi:hypothetical protein
MWEKNLCRIRLTKFSFKGWMGPVKSKSNVMTEEDVDKRVITQVDNDSAWESLIKELAGCCPCFAKERATESRILRK